MSVIQKQMIKRCTFILLSCIFYNWFARINVDIRAKVGVLFLNNSSFSLSNHSVNYRLSDERYVYPFYDRRKVEEVTIWNVKSAVNATQSSAVRTTEYVNHLAEKAYTDGMDYLFLTRHYTVSGSFNKDMTIHIVQKLKEHNIPNIGVVTDINSDNKQAHKIKSISVHKTHMEIFQQFFPRHLSFKNAIEWMVDVYNPYHITYLKTLKFNPLFRTGQLEEKEVKSMIFYRNKVTDYIIANYPLFVVSYSLYGSHTRYTDGALANTELVKRIYPNWKMWIYCDDSVPNTILSSVCRQTHTTCFNMTGTKLKNRRMWRFLVASVPFVTRYVIRDIDSRLSEREKAAVDEWIQSGERFHVMRDHPSHEAYPIGAGLWGGTRNAIPNMKELLEERVLDEAYIQDTIFLKDTVWPIARTSVYQHDSFSCDKFGGGHPFPTRRIGLEHVGSVYIDGQIRQIDTDILNITKPPKNCNL